ncbi:MAG: FAD-dependent oxidoreductase [Nocardioidaceae bacterium]
MTKPVVFVVDDEADSLRALTSELESRYGAHYTVESAGSPEEALLRLERLAADGSVVPLVLADQWMPRITGAELLARVRRLHPTARWGLLYSWFDWTTSGPILAATALGQLHFHAAKPVWTPDEQFHRAVTEALDEWWQQQGGRFEAVTIVADDPSTRGHEIRDLLTRNNVPFGFLSRDSAEGAATLARLGLQGSRGPVVAMFNGALLVDPSNAEVAAALGVDTRPSGRTYDVAIVGAGPAGLAAAVYAASEGLGTVLVEPVAFGGQAGTSSMIRNYLGFPRGVSGTELAGRAYVQAWGFGTHLVYGHAAAFLREDGDLKVLGLDDGTEVRARAVVVATGVSYRRLGVASLEGLLGAGVFYGAATTEAPALAGKQAFVVGGGNSAGQAALHLAKYADRVTLLVRADSLAASMSDYLIREIDLARNLDVRHGVEVVGGSGDGRLERLDLRERRSGTVETVRAEALFALIGARPFTDWLPEQVDRDEWGFLHTGRDYQTRMRGVFAVGDVRHGSVKRVASAVGEGSVVIGMVHDFLALAPR